MKMSKAIPKITHNKRMQSDQSARYAFISGADARRYELPQ